MSAVTGCMRSRGRQQQTAHTDCLRLGLAALGVHVVSLCLSCLLCPVQCLQSALDAEMEERRKRVEEWRKKRAEEAAAAAAAEQERKQQEEAAAAAAAAAESNKKGWSLEDDEDDDEHPQQAGGEVRLGGELCGVVHRPCWVEDAQALPGVTSMAPKAVLRQPVAVDWWRLLLCGGLAFRQF